MSRPRFSSSAFSLTRADERPLLQRAVKAEVVIMPSGIGSACRRRAGGRTGKVWVDHLGHVIRTNGAADIVKCPLKVAVVSIGLMMMSEERDCLLRKRVR